MERWVLNSKSFSVRLRLGVWYIFGFYFSVYCHKACLFVRETPSQKDGLLTFFLKSEDTHVKGESLSQASTNSSILSVSTVHL